MINETISIIEKNKLMRTDGHPLNVETATEYLKTHSQSKEALRTILKKLSDRRVVLLNDLELRGDTIEQLRADIREATDAREKRINERYLADVERDKGKLWTLITFTSGFLCVLYIIKMKSKKSRYGKVMHGMLGIRTRSSRSQ